MDSKNDNDINNKSNKDHKYGVKRSGNLPKKDYFPNSVERAKEDTVPKIISDLKKKGIHLDADSLAIGVALARHGNPICVACRKNPMSNPEIVFKLCARCQYVYYCGKECQTADWPTHKTVCKKAIIPVKK